MSNILEMVKYNADGLIPAVTQDIRTDEVLMLAYMNEESLRKTIGTGLAHYYSRSRQKLWLKGETSGHFQKVRSISVDCDGDTLLLKVEQTGAACHTGHRSCFFTRLEADELRTGSGITNSACDTGLSVGEAADNYMAGKMAGSDMTGKEAGSDMTGNAAGSDMTGTKTGTPKDCPNEADNTACDSGKEGAGPEVLGEVFGVILDRLAHPKEGSYTNYLFTKGLDKILKKIGEEACETVIASKNGSASEISAEISDLLYHIMVLLAEKGMTLDDIYKELRKRE